MQSLEDPAVKIDEPRTATDQTGTVSQSKTECKPAERQEINRPQDLKRKGVQSKERHQARAVRRDRCEDFAELLGETQGGIRSDLLNESSSSSTSPIGRAEELEVERISGLLVEVPCACGVIENSENHRSVFREGRQLRIRSDRNLLQGAARRRRKQLSLEWLA